MDKVLQIRRPFDDVPPHHAHLPISLPPCLQFCLFWVSNNSTRNILTYTHSPALRSYSDDNNDIPNICPQRPRETHAYTLSIIGRSCAAVGNLKTKRISAGANPAEYEWSPAFVRTGSQNTIAPRICSSYCPMSVMALTFVGEERRRGGMS